jgi:hypothetical protein
MKSIKFFYIYILFNFNFNKILFFLIFIFKFLFFLILILDGTRFFLDFFAYIKSSLFILNIKSD